MCIQRNKTNPTGQHTSESVAALDSCNREEQVAISGVEKDNRECWHLPEGSVQSLQGWENALKAAQKCGTPTAWGRK